MAMEYVQKRPIKVVLWTNVAKIEGTTFSLQSANYARDNRLSDLMNFEGQKFLPVSNAKAYSAATNELIGEMSFININKLHIIMITEVEE